MVDEDTREVLTPEIFQACVEEHAAFIEFMQDLGRGIITITLAEHRRIPARTLDLMRVYKDFYRSKK